MLMGLTLCVPQAHNRAPGLINLRSMDFNNNNRHFLEGFFRAFNVLMGIKDVGHGEILECIWHGILSSLPESLSPRDHPGARWSGRYSQGLGSESLLALRFVCTHFHFGALFVFESLGTQTWAEENGKAGLPGPSLPLCAHCLSLVREGTRPDKRAIPGHQGHWHVWERFLGSGDTL